jgi:hypothetical protein
MEFEDVFRRINHFATSFRRTSVDFDSWLLALGPSFHFDAVDGPGLALVNHLGSPWVL